MTYPSIYNLGHRAIQDLLTVPVMVQEKVDGSQFTFWHDSESLHFRSKRTTVYAAEPGMFQAAVKNIQWLHTQIGLRYGYIYRGEYLLKPHHNTLKYNRVPNWNVILFDIQSSANEGDYLTYDEMKAEADRLGMEVVPLLAQGMVTMDVLQNCMENESILGGTQIEGVVIKQITPTLWGADKKPLIGKLVREDFKEQHKVSWKAENPGQGDIIERLVDKYRTDARWNKSIQHLRDDGKLTNSPADIGLILRETSEDLLRETSDEIKEDLFRWAIKNIQRGVNRGLPEYYKNSLSEQ
jgi:hypothetical protein